MTDDLGAVVRGIAREEGVAAELDRPYTVALRDRYLRDVRRRRTAGVAGLALVTAVVVGGGALGADRLALDLPPVDLVVTDPTPSWTPAPTWVPTPLESPPETPLVSPEPTPTPTPPPSPTSPPPEPADDPTTPPPPPPPAPTAAPTGVYAVPGGGSGEVLVIWEMVPGATGYRVYRTSTAGGPFSLSASYDMASGVTTVALDGYEYIYVEPEPLSTTQLRYTEAIRNEFTWFRVSAFTAGGEGPTSGTVCAGPPTATMPQPADC